MPADSKFLIVLLGSTGVGKTDLSITLSYEFKAPIISADSRQFYKEMKIGTAMPSQTILNSTNHHFIGNKSIHERFSCGMFELEVLDLLENFIYVILLFVYFT